MSANKPYTLDDWIEYAQTVHFRSIDMTLERVRTVYNRLNTAFSHSVVIIVGGTNGKGSSVAMLEAIYNLAGYTTGAFTSPHLIRFNERYRLNRQSLMDTELTDSFAKIEQIRGDIPLTYFEFASLIAIDCFASKNPDVLIMETGMGGRLDSVNILEPDCVLLTHVALDHTQWLGETREQIGFEKAGLFRPQIPVICGDKAPPASLLQQAEKLQTQLKLINKHYQYSLNGEFWDWQGRDEMYLEYKRLPLPSIPGHEQVSNAAGVLMAVYCLRDKLSISEAAIRLGLENSVIQGRLQHLTHQNRQVILDVAHNPDAVAVLNTYLGDRHCSGNTIAVLGMLNDKDIQQVISLIRLNIARWELAPLDEPRGATAEQLAQRLLQVDETVKYNCHPSVIAAFEHAVNTATVDDRIVVFGSFHTVGDVLKNLTPNKS